MQKLIPSIEGKLHHSYVCLCLCLCVGGAHMYDIVYGIHVHTLGITLCEALLSNIVQLSNIVEKCGMTMDGTTHSLAHTCMHARIHTHTHTHTHTDTYDSPSPRT